MTRPSYVHEGTRLTPTKLELIADWAPQQPWFIADADQDVRTVGTFRFTDPDGQVGIETLIICAGGKTFQVPLTYRGAPLPGADDHLVGVLQHSVLGTRFVYDGPADPVYVDELVRVIAEGDTEADVIAEGAHTPRPKSVTVKGSGAQIDHSAGGSIVLVRLLDGSHVPTNPVGSLTASWVQDGQPCEAVLAALV